MIYLDELVEYCDELLEADRFSDYCPNGLQIEGRREVKKIMVGVTASQALIDAAVSADVDVLLVHHGFFWKGESPVITGIKAQRIRALMNAGISLLAYHLPLDAHKELGNNRQLADLLGIRVEGGFGKPGEIEIGLLGSLSTPLKGADLARHISKVLDRQPMHISTSRKPLNRVAWCTGAAQGYFEAAIAMGVDGFITGEISEPVYHMAMESGVDYFAAGHHATERYGVQALGGHLGSRFGLPFVFFDINNPV